jgi:gamma-glutamyl hydrolase
MAAILNHKLENVQPVRFQVCYAQKRCAYGDTAPLITAHFHNFSLPLKLFLESEKLKIFYKIITTNVDRNGVEYVSTMEPKKYPFYSMQWHPENSPFEWQPKKAIPHLQNSIELCQYIANFFVQEARFRKHKFATGQKLRDRG